LSNLASFGHLATDAREGTRKTAKEEVMRPGVASAYLRKRLQQLALAFALVVESALLSGHRQDACAAARELIEREDATAARFATAQSWIASDEAGELSTHERTKTAA
jgi:hypothetical protein